MGLYARLAITETPVFLDAIERRERLAVPMPDVLRNHLGMMVSGTLGHERPRLRPGGSSW
jgi:hypothetical protein